MSKDDGTYILQTRADKSGSIEYRVAHVHAIENIYSDKSLIYTIFSDSQVYNKLEKAIEEARKIDAGFFSHYGVLVINDFRENRWPEIEIMGKLDHPSHHVNNGYERNSHV